VVILDTLAAPANPYSLLEGPGMLATIRTCCRSTILSHVQHNPMMVCAECKTMIKCFKDRRASINYETFCKSKNRRILSIEEGGMFFILFNEYDSTNI
jgi:hypothetical protein